MQTDQRDAVRTLTFDRPERLNAVTADDINEMADAVEACAADDTVDVVVIAGQGKAFCSGADIGDGAAVADRSAETIDAANRLVTAIVGSPKVTVARARGVVAGAGVAIALAADLAAADEQTYFLLAFTRVGLMPDAGATALVTAAVGRARALQLALLAEPLPATDAVRAGLISHVWPIEEYDDAFERVVDKVARGPLAAMARTKEAINACALPDFASALARERIGQMDLLAAPDFAAGAEAFAERRPPVFADRPGRQSRLTSTTARRETR